MVAACVAGPAHDERASSSTREEIAILVQRAKVSAAAIAQQAQAQLDSIERVPAAVRAAAGSIHASGVTLAELARGLDALALRAPESRELGARAAAVRDEVRALGVHAASFERAARELELLMSSLRLSVRFRRQIDELALRIEAETDGDITQLHGALVALVDELAAHERALPANGARDAANLATAAAARANDGYPPLAAEASSIANAAAQWRSGSAGAIIDRTDAVLTAYAGVDRDVSDSVAEAIDATVDAAKASGSKVQLELAAVLNLIELLFIPKPAASTSFRILTYNTAFVSATFELPFPVGTYTYDLNDGVFSGLDYPTRAHEIAKAILRGDQEVVVLNEVFSDDVRTILINELHGTYPNYVAKLAGPPKKNIPFIFDEYLAGVAKRFGGEVAGALVDVLFALWPDQTDYLVIPGDSGLMVFSKYPFLPLEPGAPNDASCSGTACAFQGSNSANAGGALLVDEVAFHIYEECALDDCFASKGVGVVKIDTPARPSFVAFTHAQADADGFPEQNASVRATQFLAVKDTIAASAAAGSLAFTPVYFTGDLNTPGHNRVSTEAPSEWFDAFDPTSGGENFLSCGNNGPCSFDLGDGALLTDSWGFETSVLDLGLSQLNDHERLDYILHNAPDGRWCMQHVHIAWDLADSGSVWYSDHLPIRADFNGAAQACSANDAAGESSLRPRDIVFPSADCDANPMTPAPTCDQNKEIVPPFAKLQFAGSYQWYRLEQAGSYSINLLPMAAGENVAFDVYQGEDLSRPIEPFSKDVHPRWGTPFAMLHPPYYVRVYAVDANGAPDRTAKDRDYQILFHQHLCRDPEDACFLPAANKYPYLWPEVSAFTNVDALYFKFKTSGVKLGHLDPMPERYPTVKFQEEALMQSQLDCLKPLALEEYAGMSPPVFVQDFAFTGVEIDGDHDWDDDGSKDKRHVAPNLDGDTLDDFKIYIVKMGRVDQLECAGPMTTQLRFETNLTFFQPNRVRCYQQYDDSGIGEDDHVKFHNFFDTPYVLDWNYCDTHPCHGAVFDEPAGDGWLSAVPLLQGYFVDGVRLGMWEDDNGPDLLFATGNAIGTLHPWFERTDSLVHIEETSNPEESDYTYKMWYAVCREKAGCKQP